MIKVERFHNTDKWHVTATWREPFEDLFEIAHHNARFAHPRDAQKLADRVKAAVKAAYPNSPAFVIGRDHWTFQSSAYSSRIGTTGQVYVVPTSEAARKFEMARD